MIAGAADGPTDIDIAIIGGGFYGCCLALFMRSVYEKVVIFERGNALLERASAVNQARVHAGFHYPRSFVTALRSIRNVPRFIELFPTAIVDDFDMLYAIARQGSKVTANRFLRMFESMRAPIAPASAAQRALFAPELIDDVFACREFAFDWTVLRSELASRLDAAGVEVRFGAEVAAVTEEEGALTLTTSGGERVAARAAFNASYSAINAVLIASGMAALPMKHEWTEIALIDPPDALRGIGITLMDGPFFSTMPYPSEGAYSLTHVRYTPHLSWVDRASSPKPFAVRDGLPRVSRWYHMVADAGRFVASLRDATLRKSLFEVKTILTRNEGDDGRPILFHRQSAAGRLYSVLGGKIDNIFDLFTAVRDADPAWAGADARYLTPR